MSNFPTQTSLVFAPPPQFGRGGFANTFYPVGNLSAYNNQANNFNSSFGQFGFTPFIPYGYQQPDQLFLQAIFQLINHLVNTLIQQLSQNLYPQLQENQAINGSGNNPFHPGVGQANSLFLRTFAQDPSRGIGGSTEATLPSARAISNAVSTQTSPTENHKGLSDMFWLWGQFVDHDINLTPANGESANIPVPQGDPAFDPNGTGTEEIPFSRSNVTIDANGNRQQNNAITAFIDGSNVYGSDIETTNNLRSFSGGQLKTSAGNLLPIGDDGMFQAGDVRANVQTGLTSMHTLWMREHNRIATELATQNPNLSDEELFQGARKQVIAEIQAITFNEYLPELLGENNISAYHGYNPTVNPQISETFATSAFRFGHSMLSPEILRLDEQGNEIPEGNLSLSNAYFQPQYVQEAGIDPVLRGFATQVAQEADPMVIDDIRDLLFGQPGSGGLDLAALNIQRGRDHELPSYNDIRESLGLRRITSFDDPIFQGDFGAKMASVYNSPDDVDAWVGGLAEKPVGDALLGESMTLILKDQFERLRDGDRFWYQNQYSGSTLDELNNLTLSDIIRRNSDVQNIQDHSMVAPGH